MSVYRLDLAYDGSGFNGFAAQPDLRTVQGALETALATVLGAEVQISVAGRTDAGVHARGQVVSFQTDADVDTGSTLRALNGLLGPEIGVNRLVEADDGFDARFSAVYRRYRYCISTGVAADPLSRHFVWHVGRPLDVVAMEVVAAQTVGERDFSSFCRAAPGRSNMRRVDEAYWVDTGERLEFWIRADSFCHQMVRSLVGLSYDVGRGFTPVDRVTAVFEAEDRAGVATVAPPHGLTLWEVGYPV